MKKIIPPTISISHILALLLGVTALLLASPSAHAAIITKAASGKPLDTASSWSPARLPTNTDIATWNSTSLGKSLTMSASNETWLGINITGAVSDIGVNSIGFTLTNGVAGITNTSAGTNFTWNGNIFLNGSQTWWANPGVKNQFGNIISGSGASSLTIAGGGATVFIAINTYSGSTTVITPGTSLTVSSSQTGTGAISLSDGTTLTVSVFTGSQLSPSSYSLGSSAGPTTNTFTGLNSTNLAAINTGALTLTGTTKINIGTSTLSVGIFPLISYTSISGTGGFVMGSLPPGVTANIITNNSAIALNVTAVTPYIWTGSVNSNWDTITTNWTYNGSPALYVDGNAVQFDDTSSVNNVTVTNANVFPSSVTVNNTTKAYTFTNSGVAGFGLLGSPILTKTGTNTLTLSTATTNLSTVTISTGTLLLNAGTFTLSKNCNVACNGILDLNNTAEQFVKFTGNGTVLAEDFGQITFGVGTATFSFDGIISDTPAHNTANTLIKGGQGVATLTGLNTYHGSTQIQKTTLSLGDGTTAGNIANSTSINFQGTDNSHQATLIINYPAGSSNGYPGSITGQGFLIKNGAGTYSLSGNNSFSSAGSSTTINGGTLQVDGSLAAENTVSVLSGGTLAGTGSIGDATTVSSGGTLAPGDQNGVIGNLTFSGNLTNLGGSAFFRLNKTNSPATNDSATITGTLSVTGGILTVSNTGPALVAGDTFKLFNQPASGFTTVNLPTLNTGLAWVNNLAVDGSIQIVVPMPPYFPPDAVTRLPDGNISLTATGALGATYKLWASTNIASSPVTNTWTLLNSGTITSSPFTNSDLTATNYPQRFYLFSAP